MSAGSHDGDAETQGPPAGEAFGGYVKAAPLGKGAFGEVWKAWDPALARWVALKLLHHENEEELKRFLREAQTAAALVHPNIAAVHQVGVHDGRHYIAMQFVDGRTLERNPRQDAREATRLIRDAARAVAYAHGRDVIHRDLKPANIMVDRDGRVYVMDFGLARRVDLKSSLSQTGMMVGTPSYMSPEQARGEKADARSDVYSLGATLYELLAGRPPISGDGLYELLAKVVSEEPARVRLANPKVDGDLDTIVMKCLEKDPARRYPGAAALADDLTRCLEGEPIAAHAPSALYRLRKGLARRRAVAVPAAAAALMAVALGAWAVAGAISRSGRVEQELLRAGALEREGRPDRAREVYRSVLDLAPGHGQARAALERLDARLKEAIALLEAGRQLMEEGVACQYRKETTRFDLERYGTDAQERIERALKLAPHLPLGHHLLGRVFESLGYEDRAADCYRRALALDAGFGPAHYQLGAMLLARALLLRVGRVGELRAARGDEAERLIAEAGRAFEAARGNTGFQGDLRGQVAAALRAYARGDIEGVRREAQAGIDRFGGALGAEDFHILLGATAPSTREAIAAYTQALDVRPTSALARVCRAGASAESYEGIDSALEDCAAAIQISPRFAEAYYIRATMLAQFRGEPEAALRDLDKVLRQLPRSAPAFCARASVRAWQLDWEGAAADCEQALMIDAATPEAHHWRAHVREALGDFAGAEADFAQAGRPAPWLCRAKLLKRKGDLAGALRECREAAPLAPLLRACILRAVGDRAGALAACEEQMRAGHHVLAACVARAALRRAAGDLEGAIADCRRVVAADPGYAQAYLWLAELRRTAGDPAGAAEDEAEARRLDPRCALEPSTRREESLAEAPRDAASFRRRGDAHEASGDVFEAMADYQQAIRLEPGHAYAYRRLADVRRCAGELHGMIHCAQAVAADPSDVTSLRRLADMRKLALDHRGAYEDYAQAVKRAPRDGAAWRGRAWVLLDASNRYPECVSDSTEAIRLNPSDGLAYRLRGEALRHLDDFKRALPDLNEAIRLRPFDSEAWRNRGSLRRDQKDRDGAMADYARALELDPANRQAYLSRAEAHEKFGDVDAAVADCSEVLKLDPDHAQALYSRGRNLEKKGAAAEAVADYERVLKVASPRSPYRDKAEKALARLRKP